MNKYLIICAALILSACSYADGAQKALYAAGYTNIKTHGYSVFGCGRDDNYSTTFTAKGPTGVEVSGVVCSGFFKGSTIRIN